MAVKKPVTRDDIVVVEPKAQEGYSVVVSPSGAVSTVPDGIKQSLLDSGYTAK